MKIERVARPWGHLRIDDALPKYDRLLSEFPAATLRPYDHPDSLDTGRPTRFRYDVNGQSIHGLPAVWRDMARWLLGDEVKGQLSEALGVDGAGLAPKVHIFRDIGGFWIAPHPDTGEKKITAHFYLARGDEDADALGTRMYGQSGEQAIVPFLPNAGYAFLIGDHTLHGVERLPDGSVRDSVMLRYH